MTDYIRKAVELADGWEWLEDDSVGLPDGHLYYLNETPPVATPEEHQHVLDALAAQLTRQVDVLPTASIELWTPKATKIWDHALGYVGESDGDDRTMNTLRAIIDSKVLE